MPVLISLMNGLFVAAFSLSQQRLALNFRIHEALELKRPGGEFYYPWIMGRSLTLNPVIILLSLTFWGWMWGIVGIILAVPILAAFKIFCAHIKPMEPLAEFLG